MGKTVVGQGTHGGFDLLGGRNERRDPDSEELTERNRARTVDATYSVLSEVLGTVIGPAIMDFQVAINKPGLRQQDITFDRLYKGPPAKSADGDTKRGSGALNLLVHNFSTRKGVDWLRAHADNQSAMDDEMKLDLEMRTKYASENGYLFLPIIDGQIQREDLERLQVVVKDRLAKAA